VKASGIARIYRQFRNHKLDVVTGIHKHLRRLNFAQLNCIQYREWNPGSNLHLLHKDVQLYASCWQARLDAGENTIIASSSNIDQ
jgi:hypothetical protein